MKKICSLLCAIITLHQSYADCLVINEGNGLQVKTNTLTASNGYRCLAISIFSTPKPGGRTPFVLLKHFYHNSIYAQLLDNFNLAAYKSRWINNYIENVEKNMLSKQGLSADETELVMDSLVYVENAKCYLIKGIIMVELYSIAGNTHSPSLHDSHILDTTAKISTINTKEYNDEIPVRINEGIGTPDTSLLDNFDKTYLLEKSTKGYLFFRMPVFCHDCAFSFKKSFRVNFQTGLTELYSKYIYITGPEHAVADEVIITSQYYHFQ